MNILKVVTLIFFGVIYISTLAFTGHRPHKLNGYNMSDNKDLIILMHRMIERYIIVHKIDTFITGMALGIDTWSALSVLELKKKYPHIKLVCAIPCLNQYATWSLKDVQMYFKITKFADDVYYISDKPYTANCMIKRDEWMVDKSDRILSIWNEKKHGGTWHTVKYAKSKNKEIYNINPDTLKIKLIGDL